MILYISIIVSYIVVLHVYALLLILMFVACMAVPQSKTLDPQGSDPGRGFSAAQSRRPEKAVSKEVGLA